ncbi:amino acid permease [bacterium]|nr:amino acid permease [bacterium]
MSTQERHIGLFSATSIGIGAIVGGGILALAGTAFVEAGPGAIVAFALNGVIAVLTALTFAELSTAFPESGGTYLFSKRVLSVGAAFVVGWIVWFASIVAAALYAMGFASFLIGSLAAAYPETPAWITTPAGLKVIAILSVVLGFGLLARKPGSGGNWVNVLKIIVFSILIVGGVVVWIQDRPPVVERLTPFLPLGMGGVLSAMGFTFIALQGFDLIAAAAGEVKEPRRVLPRAMLMSLGAALVVYLPLLLIVVVLGTPAGETIRQMAERNPDTVVAEAAGIYLGRTGFWIVMASGLLAMWSAMLANVFAASRIAQAMARDRTLPANMEAVHVSYGTPLMALLVTAAVICVLLLAIRDVSAAGAASSLIFLLTFAIAHLICILARRRRPNHDGFRVPIWPYVPAVGGTACIALAIFQGAVVPSAGMITGGWLVLGFFCYQWIFRHRAQVSDAASELADPDLLELRGQSPLVLVPIANPASAGSLATMASFMSPRAGRILLLNIVKPAAPERVDENLEVMSAVLRRSMAASLGSSVRVECLATFSADPWSEIARVADTHRCALALMGMTDLRDDRVRERLERLVSALPGNAAILRAPIGWRPDHVQRVLVPIGGRGVHNALRARLLTALDSRTGTNLEVRYLIVIRDDASEREAKRLRANWEVLVRDESGVDPHIDIVRGSDPGEVIVNEAAQSDLLILGLNRVDRSRQVFGKLVTGIVSTTDCPVIVIGQRQ